MTKADERPAPAKRESVRLSQQHGKEVRVSQPTSRPAKVRGLSTAPAVRGTPRS